MTAWSQLNGVLAGIPDLPGAACVGLAGMFDPRRDGELPDLLARRHALAVKVCTTCPALQPCRVWARTLDNRRIRGVVAGHVRRDPKPRPSITSKEAA